MSFSLLDTHLEPALKVLHCSRQCFHFDEFLDIQNCRFLAALENPQGLYTRDFLVTVCCGVLKSEIIESWFLAQRYVDVLRDFLILQFCANGSTTQEKYGSNKTHTNIDTACQRDTFPGVTFFFLWYLIGRRETLTQYCLPPNNRLLKEYIYLWV